MHVTMGSRELVLDGDYLALMRESTELLAHPEALAERFERDGYLLLRGVLDDEVVGAARRLLVDRLRERDQLAPLTRADDMVAAPRASGELPDPRRDRATGRLLRTLLEARPLERALAAVLGETPVPVQVVPHADGHGCRIPPHVDDTRTDECACWVAVDDVDFRAGPIAVLEGSHRAPALRRAFAEGAMRASVIDPIALVDAYGGRWLTASLHAGDTLLVRRGLVYGSLNNTTGRFRLTCEARFAAADRAAGLPARGRGRGARLGEPMLTRSD